MLKMLKLLLLMLAAIELAGRTADGQSLDGQSPDGQNPGGQIEGQTPRTEQKLPSFYLLPFYVKDNEAHPGSTAAYHPDGTKPVRDGGDTAADGLADGDMIPWTDDGIPGVNDKLPSYEELVPVSAETNGTTTEEKVPFTYVLEDWDTEDPSAAATADDRTARPVAHELEE